MYIYILCVILLIYRHSPIHRSLENMFPYGTMFFAGSSSTPNTESAEFLPKPDA